MPTARRGCPGAWLLGCALFGLGGSSVRADDDVHLSVTNTSSVEYRTDNLNSNDADDNYGAIFDRMNIQGGAGPVDATARIDGFGFLWPPDDGYVSQIRLERAALRYKLGDFTLEVGDFYEQFGRGFVLSIRKQQEAGVDISIFGAKASYRSQAHTVTLFAGRANTANTDAISRRFVADKRDLLAGGLYQLTATPRLKTGVYGLYNQPEERLIDESLDFTVNGGAYIDASTLADWFGVYLEVAAQERSLAGDFQPGSALYLQTETRVWDFTLFTEGMLLNQFEQKGSRNTALGSRFNYNRPPTLERIDQEVLNNRNTVGGRVRLEYFYLPLNLLIYGNVMLRLNDYLDPAQVVQFHGFGGMSMQYNGGASRIAIASGYRHEQQPAQPIPIKTIVHLDVDYLQALGWDFALHLVTQTWFRTLEGRRYLFGSTFLGIERAGLGGLTFELGYDTFDPSPDVRNVFYALILNAEINRHFTFRGTAGTQRGGIKCIAGVCREFPAFSGVQAQLISRF